MSATRRPDSEEYQRAQAAAREIREVIGDQLHDLVIEREDFGTYGELVEKVRQLGRIGKQISEAKGRQAQAEEMGLPRAKFAREEREALTLLRSAVMSLGASCGAWAAALDFDDRRHELDAQTRNGKRQPRRQDEDEDDDI